MKSLPSALFIIDPETERIAVREANRLSIPVVALVDTNCDPDRVDFVIPGNDDALKSVTLFVNLIADACIEGAQVFEQRMRNQGVSTATHTNVPGVEAATPASTGPVVERVIRKKLRIPTEIDYREQDGDDDVTEVTVEAEIEIAEDSVEADKSDKEKGKTTKKEKE